MPLNTVLHLPIVLCSLVHFTFSLVPVEGEEVASVDVKAERTAVNGAGHVSPRTNVVFTGMRK